MPRNEQSQRQEATAVAVAGSESKERYVVEYKDPRGRWHRRRASYNLASQAVEAARDLAQRCDVYGFRVLDADGQHGCDPMTPRKITSALTSDASAEELATALGAIQRELDRRAADARSAIRYIEQRYGRLDGVGWDRVL